MKLKEYITKLLTDNGIINNDQNYQLMAEILKNNTYKMMNNDYEQFYSDIKKQEWL